MVPLKQLFLFSCIPLFFSLGVARSPPVEIRCQFGLDAAKQAAKAVSELSVKLYGKITAAKPDANAVFSPVSIALGLALLERGARHDTLKELQVHLGPPGSNESDSSHLYQALQQGLTIQDEKTKLNIANGIFHYAPLLLNYGYYGTVEQCFNGTTQEVPFRINLEEARRTINQWVSNVTEQKIAELFKPNSLHKDTSVILANAVHMKAAWRHKFEKVENNTFYQKLGSSYFPTRAVFMMREDKYSYSADEDMQVVEIPYQNVFSMYIILPKQREGIKSVESTLTGEKLRSLFSMGSERQVTLKVPKFGIRLSTDLNAILEQMGVKKMFSDEADFFHMSAERLKVSKAVHEAYIKVNENGTEAAAATGVEIVPIMAPAPPPDPPVSFIADHPFIYAILHKPTSTILFLGKVNFVEE